MRRGASCGAASRGGREPARWRAEEAESRSAGSHRSSWSRRSSPPGAPPGSESAQARGGRGGILRRKRTCRRVREDVMSPTKTACGAASGTGRARLGPRPGAGYEEGAARGPRTARSSSMERSAPSPGLPSCALIARSISMWSRRANSGARPISSPTLPRTPRLLRPSLLRTRSRRSCAQDAPRRPEVDRRAVPPVAAEQLWRAVPPRDRVRREETTLVILRRAADRGRRGGGLCRRGAGRLVQRRGGDCGHEARARRARLVSRLGRERRQRPSPALPPTSPSGGSPASVAAEASRAAPAPPSSSAAAATAWAWAAAERVGPTPRAMPKSAILRSQFALTSRLEGLMSLWMTPAECSAARPRSSCHAKKRACRGGRARWEGRPPAAVISRAARGRTCCSESSWSDLMRCRLRGGGWEGHRGRAWRR